MWHLDRLRCGSSKPTTDISAEGNATTSRPVVLKGAAAAGAGENSYQRWYSSPTRGWNENLTVPPNWLRVSSGDFYTLRPKTGCDGVGGCPGRPLKTKSLAAVEGGAWQPAGGTANAVIVVLAAVAPTKHKCPEAASSPSQCHVRRT
jgi:hypothetical protein